MKDRIPGAPGQYKAVIETDELQKMQLGNQFTITMTRDDQPVVEGTPYSKAAILPDSVAALICPEIEDPTPADALRSLKYHADTVASRFSHPCNLLDNSDFTNPVNQRGIAEYSGVAQYTIDRWKATAVIDVVVSDGYVTVKCTEAATARNGFSQYFAEEKTPEPGTAITVAYADNEGNVYVGSTAMPQSGSVNIGDTTEIGVRVVSAEEGARVVLLLPPSRSINLKWLAVYEGEYTADTLPAYHPKGYAAELAECQRYYRQISSMMNSLSLGVGVCISSYVYVPFYIGGMRITPTLTGEEGLALTNSNADTNNVSAVSLFSVSPQSNYATLRITPSETVTSGSFYRLALLKDNVLELSADL